jgi:DNA-binding HxlR family transcriptional regulator
LKAEDQRLKWEDLAEQRCSIARSVAVIGDRWTLMILRDCFSGVKRFDKFKERLGISRTIIAERLQLLTTEGVLTKTAYQDRPVRYEYHLTDKGMDLFPVMMAIVHWGDRHIDSPTGKPLVRRHKTCGHDFDPVMVCSECGETVEHHEVESHSAVAA